jgi:hypothetical protein
MTSVSLTFIPSFSKYDEIHGRFANQMAYRPVTLIEKTLTTNSLITVMCMWYSHDDILVDYMYYILVDYMYTSGLQGV